MWKTVTWAPYHLAERERMMKGIARELGKINWAQDAIDVHHGETPL